MKLRIYDPSEQIDPAVDLGAIPPPTPKPVRLRDMFAEQPAAPPELVSGILHQGCKLILAGTSNGGVELADLRRKLTGLITLALNGLAVVQPYLPVLAFVGGAIDKSLFRFDRLQFLGREVTAKHVPIENRPGCKLQRRVTVFLILQQAADEFCPGILPLLLIAVGVGRGGK